jgi:hypothetical protein
MRTKLAESNAAPWRDRVAAEADHADRLACVSLPPIKRSPRSILNRRSPHLRGGNPLRPGSLLGLRQSLAYRRSCRQF